MKRAQSQLFISAVGLYLFVADAGSVSIFVK
jgi:hypothetical protein